MSGLRFCMVTTFYPPYNFGGDGIGIERFCKGLVRQGHEVTVVFDADAYNMLSGRVAPELPEQPPGLVLKPLQSSLGRLSCLLTQQLGRPIVHGSGLQRFLAEGRFDVINYHNISLVGGPGILRLGDALKLYMAHEHWLVCPSHVLWRHNKERCTGRECLRCVLSYGRPPQMWRYTGLLNRELRHVDTFIAMSEFSRDKHREFGFPRDMEVLPYFLPDREEVTAGGDDSSPHPRPYFLFVGRLEKIKGLDDVIPVFQDYAGADLVIAGDGEYGAALRALGQGNPRVHFLGRVDQERLAAYYRHAQALIVPSVCFETFGIILIEAFRQGTPVVARRLGPFPEILAKAKAGELFDDARDLVAALHRLQDDPARRAELSERARDAFDRHWSESAVIPRYLDIVRRAAVRRGRQAVVEKLAGAHP